MSRARLVITAVVVEGRTHADVAAQYGLSRSWVTRLVTRYRAEGPAAFEARSRRPNTSPTRTPDEVVGAGGIPPMIVGRPGYASQPVECWQP